MKDDSGVNEGCPQFSSARNVEALVFLQLSVVYFLVPFQRQGGANQG